MPSLTPAEISFLFEEGKAEGHFTIINRKQLWVNDVYILIAELLPQPKMIAASHLLPGRRPDKFSSKKETIRPKRKDRMNNNTNIMLTLGFPKNAQPTHPICRIPHPLTQNFQAALEAPTFKYEQASKHEEIWENPIIWKNRDETQTEKTPTNCGENRKYVGSRKWH